MQLINTHKARGTLFICLLLVLVSQFTNAAVYFSRQAGNWNATTTWSTTGYGGAAAASTPGAAAGDVVLISGYTVTVTATPAFAVLSITISQNNNTGTDTKLDVNTAATTLTTNSMAVTDNNQNNHMDISVSSTATLQVNGSVSVTRSTTNNRDRRLRFNILNSGRMNVTGNFTYTYNRAKDNEATAYEIQLDNSGRLDVNGNMNITLGNNSGTSNNFEFVMNNTSICNIGGALNVTLSNSNDDDVISFILNGGALAVTGTVTVSVTASQSSTVLFNLYNNATMSTGTFVYSSVATDYNNSHEFELNNTSSLTINGNLTVTYGCNGGGGGTDFNITLNNIPTFHITGNASITIQNTNEDDGINMDLNGGTFTIDGSLTTTIAVTATKNNTMDLKIDGGALTTGLFTINHNGGGNGDINIWLNNGSTASASSLTVNGNMIWNHTGGDNMYYQMNANSTMTVTGQLSATLASSSDGDIVYMYFNGGTANINSIFYDIAAGATNSNFLYFTIDGGTVNVTNSVTAYHQGGGGSGDVDFWFNRTSTANPSVLNIGGNLVMSHSGGDNIELEMNNNVTIDVAGNMIDTLISSDGDDFIFDINGGTMTVHGNLTYYQPAPSGNTEDFDLRIDGSGVLNVEGSVTINQQAGGQVIIYLNNASGTTAQFNVGVDMTVTHGTAADGVFFEIDKSSIFNVEGNLTINNNANNNDIAQIKIQNTSTVSVLGNLTMNLLSGSTSKTDNCVLDINGGTVTVGRNLVMNGSSGKDATIAVDGNSTVLTVTDTLQLNHTGGNLSYFYAGNSSGSPTITLGALKLYDSGGSQTRFRLWNSTICTVNGNISMSALAAGEVDLACYNTTDLKLRGSFVRSATPNRFGVLSCASGATVEYVGSANAQTIAGDAGSGGDGFSYSNVVLNNTSGICPSFNMTATEGNATIPTNANLTFTRGIVASVASGFFVIADNATVSGASNLSYVDGPIRKVGNDAFTFPIGDTYSGGNNYQPATISAPSNTAHHFTAEYHAADPNGGPYDVTSKDVTINHISRCEYWIINRTNGASNVNVTLSWDAGSCGVDSMPGLRVARWDGAAWRNQGNGGTTGTNAAGTVITNAAVTTFAATSPFTLSSTSAKNPLPIELISFDAIRNDKKVSLFWYTANEKNNNHFAVERSKNGVDFVELAEIQGAGNSNTLKKYNWDDIHPLIGQSYYRLKQVDDNGDFTYSAIKSIQFFEEDTQTRYSIYPNPSNGIYINVKLKGIVKSDHDVNNICVELYDMNGEKVYSSEKVIIDDEQGVTLKFNTQLKPGIYAITIKTESTVEKQLLVIS